LLAGRIDEITRAFPEGRILKLKSGMSEEKGKKKVISGKKGAQIGDRYNGCKLEEESQRHYSTKSIINGKAKRRELYKTLKRYERALRCSTPSSDNLEIPSEVHTIGAAEADLIPLTEFRRLLGSLCI